YNNVPKILSIYKEIPDNVWHDKENEYRFWQLSIPSVKNQEKVNFLFSKVDKCLQRFLGPTILKMHRDKINQSLYYTATYVNQDEVDNLIE
ncbi:7802_t:CDS:1, partial [Ambispora leptoticha]